MDHLPIEIVLDILSISEPETIATFLRTASKYRESAEPLLYDSIILKGPEARQGLLLSLEAKPHFAARVRHLAAHWKNAAYYALTPLLARTSNLESLVLRGFHRGIYHSSLSRLPRLRAVDCDCSPVVPRVITFLSEIPNLRSITLTLREYAVVSPNSPVLAETWARILTTPAAYSGPAFVLTFMPRGTSVVHVQTRGPEPVVVDALEHMRDATAGALVSLECTPLPLHPPSMGSYFPNLQFLGLFQIMTIPPQCVWSDTERANYLRDARRTNAALLPILAALRQLRHVRFWAPHTQPAHPELYDAVVWGVKGCAEHNLPSLRGFTIWSPNAREARGRFMRYTRRSLDSGEDGKSCEGWAEEYDPRQVPIRDEV